MPTLHPAAVMRNQEFFPIVVNDMMKTLVEPPEFYSLFPSIEEVQDFKATTFAFDIETPKYREMGPHAPVEMVGLCAKKFCSIVVPVRGAYTSELKRIFANAKEIIGHNSISFDMPKLQQQLGIKVPESCTHWDTMLMHHLLFPSFSKTQLGEDDSDPKSSGAGHDLEFVGTQLTDKGNWKGNKACLELYNARDVDVTWQAWETMQPMLRREGLIDLYTNTQVPLAKICSLMHDTGFKVDHTRIAEVRVKLKEEILYEEKFIPEHLRTHEVPVNKRQVAPPGTLGKSGKPVKFVLVPGTETNIPWRSTLVKQKYFYGPCLEGGLGLDPVLDPKKGTITTGKLAVTKLTARLRRENRESDARAVQAVGKLNKIDELITTFASEGMGKVERMYPHFNVHGTSSGRLSSSDPNLQNIPESTRFLYVPTHPGWKIVDVDFSNIENRLTAFLAGDTFRLDKYNDPKHNDYKLLVTRAFGISYDDVEKDNDREAPYGKCKAIVLGMNYGLGERKIANMYDMDPKEVRHLVTTWKQEMKQTSIWQQNTTQQAMDKGVLTTPFGRKRWFWTSNTYTESLSFLPQSCAADVIFRSMIALMYERIGWSEERVKKLVPIYCPLPQPARLLLQVHDSLVFECPGSLVDDLVRVVRMVMTQPIPQLNGMIIPVSVAVGESWGECEPYKIS